MSTSRGGATNRSAMRAQAVTVSRVLTATVGLIGLAGLLGWALSIEALKSVLPGQVTMKANTALALCLAAASLGLLGNPRPSPRARTAGRVLAGVVAAVGALALLEYAFGWNLGIDELLFGEPARTVATSHPGRMAPVTAAGLVAIGLALALLDRRPRRGPYPATVLAATAATLAFVRLVAFAYGAGGVAEPVSFTGLAFNTAAAFLLIGLAALAARPDRGVVGVVLGGTRAGYLARRILPAVAFLPAFLGWLRLQGEAAGLFGFEVGLALMVSAATVLVGAAVVAGIVSLQRSDLREAEAQAQVRHQAYVLDNVSDAVVATDADFVVTAWNRAAEKVSGYAAGAAVGRPVSEVLPCEFGNGGWAERIDALALGEGTHDLTLHLPGGGTMDVESTLIALQDPDDGSTIGYVSVDRDVTERRAAERRVRELNAELEQRVAERTADLEVANGRLREANEELESFAYSVSHDLRAPLRAMDGFSRALVEDVGASLPADAARYVERISAGAARMGRLIDDLLRLSRVGRADLAHETFDLSEVAADVVGALREAEPDRNVEAEITPGLVVEGDPGLLRQLLENLLGNAWKFTRGRPVGHIAFTGECRDGTMRIEVRDDGVGFDMAYAGKLFRAFQRLHTEAEFPGAGIGLATAQRVVRRHGGRIRAEGAPGAGAVFSFELPCPEGGPG